VSQKLFVLLGAVQTALLLAALVKVIGLEGTIAEEIAKPATATKETMATVDVLGQPTAMTQPISENRLRQIVREELRSQSKVNRASQEGSSIDEEPVAVSAAEFQRRYESAVQDLDYYLEQGEISDVDMAKLQMDIAMLDPEARTQMLSRLTRAINSGELRGRF